jgi:hypothetical protein
MTIVQRFALSYLNSDENWCWGTCGIASPSKERSAGNDTTRALTNWYAVDTFQLLLIRTSAETSTPRERVNPRFCRCRVISCGVMLRVTLATGLSTSAQKKFPRRRNLPFAAFAPTPASPPVRRSAVRPGFASVEIFPSRNDRYSSFSVGARNDRYARTLGLRRLACPQRRTEAQRIRTAHLRKRWRSPETPSRRARFGHQARPRRTGRQRCHAGAPSSMAPTERHPSRPAPALSSRARKRTRRTDGKLVSLMPC